MSAKNGSIKLIAGNSNPALAQAIADGIGVLREAVEDGEQRVRLAQLTRDLGTPGHVHDANRRGRRLLRSDDLGQPVEAVVRDHRHPEIRLLGDLRVRGHLRPGVRECIEERRLARVGEADDADPERHRYPAKPTRDSRAWRFT